MFSEETVNWKLHNPRQVPEYSGVGGLVRGCWESRKFMARPLDTPDREPQEYSRNINGIYLPGFLCSRYIPTIFLGFQCQGGFNVFPSVV